MEQVKISIITITYNNRGGLLQTIESVERQTFRDKEYIVIDGGSTDGSVELCKEHSAAISKFVSEKDDGIYDALNKGVRLARGEWIICMNAGDVFAADDVLEKVFAEDIPSTARFIYSDSLMEFSDGKQLLRKMDRARGDVFHQSAIYQRSLHEEYGYYIVTHPYTVSDLMFFLAIPEKCYHKTRTLISKASFGGVSSNGLWALRSAMALKVAYRMESIHKVYLSYLLTAVKMRIKRLLGVEHK